MKINKIHIHNFYSIEDITIDFSEYQGIVLLNGKNLDDGGSVGSGKSSILDAVSWGLTGKTIRKSTEEALINNKAKKDCYVSVQVNDTAFIQRSKRPSKLEFFVDEVNMTKDTALKTQEAIDEYLGINYKLLLASTVFGQHNLVEFLGSTPDEKRTIIKNFLNLDGIFSKRDKIKSFKSDLTNKVKANNHLIKEYESVSEKHRKTLEQISKDKEEGLAALNITEKDLKKYSYEEVLDLETEKTKLHREQAVLSSEGGPLEKEISILEKAIEEGAFRDEIPCPHCTNGTTVMEVTKEDLKTKQSQLNKLVDDFYELEDKYAQLSLDIKAIKIPVSSKTIAKANNILACIDKEDFIKEELKEAEAKVASLVEEVKSCNKELSIMKFWEVAFSEKGLIKYIIRNILDYFNTSCNYYLRFLSKQKLSVNFDENLKETIYNGGREVKFVSLSGGEKKKVNLAVALSLQKLLTHSEEAQTNLLFLDEVTDSLDPQSIEGLYILLQELKKTKTLFIITHSNHLKSLLVDCTELTVTKKNGVTKLL